MISGIVYFREIILESLRNVSETPPLAPNDIWPPAYNEGNHQLKSPNYVDNCVRQRYVCLWILGIRRTVYRQYADIRGTVRESVI